MKFLKCEQRRTAAQHKIVILIAHILKCIPVYDVQTSVADGFRKNNIFTNKNYSKFKGMISYITLLNGAKLQLRFTFFFVYYLALHVKINFLITEKRDRRRSYWLVCIIIFVRAAGHHMGPRLSHFIQFKL